MFDFYFLLIEDFFFVCEDEKKVKTGFLRRALSILRMMLFSALKIKSFFVFQMSTKNFILLVEIAGSSNDR